LEEFSLDKYIMAVLVGILMFFISQEIIRIPILSIIQTTIWFRRAAILYPATVAFIVALTAALFETAGRYIGIKFMLKDKLEWKNGIAYGIGHGGIESLLFAGITAIANIIYSILINAGTVKPEGNLSALVGARPDLFLISGVERFFVIIFHIALSLIVLYGIMYGKKRFILYCIGMHTLVDFIIPLISSSINNAWLTEATIALVGILSFIFILKSKKMFNIASCGNEISKA
jgi:uncharacterized membrane protein YhfC